MWVLGPPKAHRSGGGGVKKTKPNIGFNPDHVDGGGVKTRQMGYPNRGTAVGTY
jgi:hypothetical protein